MWLPGMPVCGICASWRLNKLKEATLLKVTFFVEKFMVGLTYLLKHVASRHASLLPNGSGTFINSYMESNWLSVISHTHPIMFQVCEITDGRASGHL